MDSLLYVDSEPGLLELGKADLDLTNEFKVATASSAIEALKLIKTNSYQAIVSEYLMPNMNGIEFLKKIRLTDKIPFIIFTEEGREEIAAMALENGATFYLQKVGASRPQFAELIHKIHKAIEHRHDEILISQVNRVYSVLSATKEAIIHIQDKTNLLKEICQIIVEIGGFKMAWAGFAHNETRTIVPVASYGDFNGYLETVSISTNQVLWGNSPTGTAFREKTYNYCNEITSDPQTSPWGEAAFNQGFRSILAFPFAINTHSTGVLTFYAEESGIFNDQVIRLLEEQSRDISYALAILDQ
jgi:CheY-like chemotaxis protein